MKKAFTLIELLVVIGIIAVLAGILLATISSGTESARAARCLTNMKNLAMACNTYAVGSGSYPLAGSVEIKELASLGSESLSFKYSERKGWISWNSRDAYGADSHVSSSGWFTSAYCDDTDIREYALTNGAIWRTVSANANVFVCPAHRKLMRRDNPLWSYVMNERFGYDDSQGQSSKGKLYGGIQYGTLARADRVLMFAEMQFLPNDRLDVDTSKGAGLRNDCTLQYNHDEVIGFNHPSGRRELCAHLAFADGHAEKFSVPATIKKDKWSISPSRGDLRNLTELLCKGKDVDRNGGNYKELKN